MRIRKLLTWFVLMVMVIQPAAAYAEIAGAHVYHNHMPNFFPWYDVTKYESAAVGSPIRYSYDGQVVEYKKNPPANYPKNLKGVPLPHDDLAGGQYYMHHAKVGAYQTWPANVANNLSGKFKQGQLHVTMSAAVINNVQSFSELGNVPGYENKNWGKIWRDAYAKLKTTNGKPVLDMIHFTGHHSMGPLVGNEYMLKDLIYHNVTLAQPYFLGDSFKSSKGFFPTELGFSTRIIPTLKKLGIEWSVLANVHYSRTLKDYPKELWNNPGSDTMVSPPNRADFQNTSTVGEWVSKPMFNEKQVTHNKFPFSSTPHWVKHVNPETGEEMRVVGVPVEQASSWEEGYQGSVSGGFLKKYEGLTPQKQFFVIAHDGDNSSGRAGDEGTWMNGANVTYSEAGMTGMGIDEYLVNNKPAADDVAHVQDGSWIDTRDSSADPQWHHWKLPFMIWKGQFADFNKAMGTKFDPKKNLSGAIEGASVSLEYGYHYLERNFALLQASLNYAKTAEQIWLDENPNYWQPKTGLDKEVTHAGNQLNPWMMSYPVKGDPSKNYAGGANPAELAWYFLIASIDSGFGYYDENQDDNIKPTISFNQSLHFSEPYVKTNMAKDKTGPSIWWPQRWPYNPGSANNDKSQGWTPQFYNNKFAVYTYAYDVNSIAGIKLLIRKHTSKEADAKDNTFRVYDPKALKAKGIANIDPSKVGDWKEYPMLVRELESEMNGVPWQQADVHKLMTVVSAKKTGDLYFSYVDDLRDELVDYYIEAIDSKGNVTRSDIQQVYVGAGKYSKGGVAGYTEDPNGSIEGTDPFITRGAARDNIKVAKSFTSDGKLVTVTTPEPTYDPNIKEQTPTPSTPEPTTKPTTKPTTNTETGTGTEPPATSSDSTTIYYKSTKAKINAHYLVNAKWTAIPGVEMQKSAADGYFELSIPLNGASEVKVAFNDGNNNWDNNGRKDYTFTKGNFIVDEGQVKEGVPVGAAKPTVKPIETEKPVITPKPIDTTNPSVTEKPDVTNTPVITIRPVITTKPTSKPITSAIPTVDPNANDVQSGVDANGIVGFSNNEMLGIMKSELPLIQLNEDELGIRFSAEIANLWQGKDLIIQNNYSYISIPQDSMRSLLTMVDIQNTNAKEIVIVLKAMGPDELSDISSDTDEKGLEVRLAGPVVIFEVGVVTTDKKVIPVSEFQKPLELSMGYNPEEEARLVGIYSVDPDGGNDYIGGTLTDDSITEEIYLSGQYVVAAYDKRFSDIPDKHWAYNVIRELTAKHVVSGVTATKFAPNLSVTRAEFATFIVRALNLPITYDSSFRDVDKSKWYAKFISTVADAKIVSGKGNGLFAPEKKVTQQEMLSMIVRAYEYVNKKPIDATELTYADADLIENWALPYVEQAVTLGIVKNHTKSLMPRTPATRAQSATAIYNLLYSLTK